MTRLYEEKVASLIATLAIWEQAIPTQFKDDPMCAYTMKKHRQRYLCRVTCKSCPMFNKFGNAKRYCYDKGSFTHLAITTQTQVYANNFMDLLRVEIKKYD